MAARDKFEAEVDMTQDAAAVKFEQARKLADRLARQQQNQAEREARQNARKAEREAHRLARQAGKSAPAKLQGLPGMAGRGKPAARFNILVVAQHGRLEREAVLFAASLRRNSPGWRGRLIIAVPREDGGWTGERTALSDAARDALAGFGAEIVPFTAQHFGRDYPYGNKIEALALLPAGEPFIFFDSDTVVTGPIEDMAINFSRPSASMRRTGTWPVPPLYGPGYTEIWKSLYDRFGLDFASSLDPQEPDEHWARYLYFNAGWFLGPDPAEFGRLFTEYAVAIRDEPGEELACQTTEVLLDQAALPLVVHALGGGRPDLELAGLDGAVTCHYRDFALAYARESDLVIETIEDVLADPSLAPVLQGWPQVADIVASGAGREQVRPLFDRSTDLNEGKTRNILKKMGLWQR